LGGWGGINVFFFLVQAQNLFILIFLQYLLFITYSDAYLTYSKI